jgi:signal transduction histidine kinase
MRFSIERASAEIRTVSYLLHPPMLDEIGLPTALRWYADGFAERSKLKVAVEVPDDFPRLIQDYELSLFRIAQECLTNIHRHSGSFTAFIRLSGADGRIDLEIRDEGKGINEEIQSKLNSGASVGVGFRGMQERVRLIGGKLTIHPNPSGNGTSVLVTLPLNEEALAPSQNTTFNPDRVGDESRNETKPAVRAQDLSL